MDAAPTLKDMAVPVEEEETETLQRVMVQGSWTTVTGQRERRRQPHITEAELQAVIQ